MRGSGIQRRRKKNNESKIIIAILSVVIILLAGGTALFFFIAPEPIEPNMEIVAFRSFLELSQNQTYIIMGDQIIKDYEPIIIDDQIYLPVDFVMDLGFAGPHLWWEYEQQLLTLTTQTELIRIAPNAETMQLNRQAVSATFDYHVNNNMAYLPLSFLEERFDIQAVLTSDNFLIVRHTTDFFSSGVISVEDSADDSVSAIQLRQFPDIQSYVLENIYDGDMVYFLDEYTFDEYEHEEILKSSTFDPDSFSRVMSTSGAIGFITNNYPRILTGGNVINEHGFTRQPDLLPRNTVGEPLIIAWDLVTTTAANYTPERRTLHPGVNIMAPKWLRFEGSSPHSNLEISSNIENISSRDYINWARNNGMQVWPLLFDYQNPRVASEILSQPNLRDHVINQLMSIAADFDFDGIMIDIEGTNASNQEYFLQFLRELAPIMREQDLIYSIAVFVPAPWRLWYNHGEIGRVVDYLAVMAYDQNVASVANLIEDATAGPNASINFVTNAVRELAEVMDSQQIILGLPFYTRIWNITYNEGVRRYADRTVGIPLTYSYFANQDWYWSDYYGSYFVYFQRMLDGQQTTTISWLETVQSLRVKANLVEEFDLAGVAGWQRMLANNAVWNMLHETVRP